MVAIGRSHEIVTSDASVEPHDPKFHSNTPHCLPGLIFVKFEGVQVPLADVVSKLGERCREPSQSVDSKGNSGDVIPLPQVPSTENIDEIQNFQRALVSYVKQRMNANRNDPAMKKIQGLVLRNAFRSGDIIAEIYPDAVKSLETWFLENKQVFTYSTGIRDVQIEFFKNTNFGNKAQDMGAQSLTNATCVFGLGTQNLILQGGKEEVTSVTPLIIQRM
ncbi:hypothetical protein TNCV_3545301 [Trichonephila clavipes]|uniref:Uncharacterized protein n=1 Tax=Trichonephila clavipes TaxID=2585209 RepID=A0A8X6RF69_TRICX|nr:hypothetical protein TNCV_3545301 [Trichonephila clavipes]